MKTNQRGDKKMLHSINAVGTTGEPTRKEKKMDPEWVEVSLGGAGR